MASSTPSGSSIAQAAMASAVVRHGGRVVMKMSSLGKRGSDAPATTPTPAALPPQTSPALPSPAPAPSATAGDGDDGSKRRRRWDMGGPTGEGLSSQPAVDLAGGTPSSAGTAASSVTMQVNKASEYEEQLRAQKEIQFLEARIRTMRVRPVFVLKICRRLRFLRARTAWKPRGYCMFLLGRAIQGGADAFAPC